MADNQTKPDTPSSDHRAMLPYWDMVETILGGSAAMRMAGKKYLPKFPNETEADYKFRVETAKFTNIYRDIVENLAAKPFSKEVAVVDGTASTTVQETAEDIDGQGNNLNVFAGRVFFTGINDAVTWIFIDKPPVPEGASRALEREIGARPYWVHVPAKRMLAVYSDVINGKEEFVHARIYEPETVRSGFGERTIKRVRVLNREPLEGGGYGPATWEVFEERDNANRSDREWVSIADGVIAIGVIAIVPFVTGRRKEGSWQFFPPMQDAAYLQVEHYQQETNLKALKEQACFPMLAGNGVTPPMDGDKPGIVPVGPKTVLFAPPNSDGAHGAWQFIEPSAQSLRFLSDDIKATEQQLRELGRQPLTAQTGNLTVVTTAFAAQKGNSAIQAWALNLKDALEQAFILTCRWLGDTSEPEVTVHTDFAIEMESERAPEFLLAMRKEREISRKALIIEAKRRDFLSPEYDEEADLEAILAESTGEDTDADINASMTPGSRNEPGDTRAPVN
jgi:hypothetical protein